MIPLSSLNFLAADVTPASLTLLQRIQHYFRDGGVFIYLLVACSLVLISVIIFKLLSLRRELVAPASLVSRLEDFAAAPHGTLLQTELTREIERSGSALSRLAATALKVHGKSYDDIASMVMGAARVEIFRLNAGMTALDVIVQIAPMCGLLGTASGLVHVFGALGENSDYTQIARGIAEALNTTITGLAIAAVGVVAHGWASRRIESYTVTLESVMTDFSHACAKPESRDS
jgi:biopolymer transport protein ExbB